jgi:hypothetical protein
MLLAIECIGLLSILDKSVFNTYNGVFHSILTSEEDQEEIKDSTEARQIKEYYLKEKIIALKATVDGLILHGICSDDVQKLFDIITGDYLKIKNRFLR